MLVVAVVAVVEAAEAAEVVEVVEVAVVTVVVAWQTAAVSSDSSASGPELEPSQNFEGFHLEQLESEL